MENIFQRPPILMRLTMLTRDKMSLLRAASLRTARETAHGLNDRKQRGWVEAGILPTELLPLNWHFKYSKINRLRARPKSASLRIWDSTVSACRPCISNRRAAVGVLSTLKMDSKGFVLSNTDIEKMLNLHPGPALCELMADDQS